MKVKLLLMLGLALVVSSGCGGSGAEVDVAALQPLIFGAKDVPAYAFTTDDFPELCDGDVFRNSTPARATSKVFQFAEITAAQTAAMFSEARVAKEEFDSFTKARQDECVRPMIARLYPGDIRIIHSAPEHLGLAQEDTLHRYRVLEPSGAPLGSLTLLTIRSGKCISNLTVRLEGDYLDNTFTVTLGKAIAERIPQICSASG